MENRVEALRKEDEKSLHAMGLDANKLREIRSQYGSEERRRTTRMKPTRDPRIGSPLQDAALLKTDGGATQGVMRARSCFVWISRRAGARTVPNVLIDMRYQDRETTRIWRS